MKCSRRLLFSGNMHPLLRAVAAFLIPIHLLTAMPSVVMAAAVTPVPQAQSGLQPPAEAFSQQTKTPTLIKRPVPVFAPPARELTFSTSPTDRELIQARVFEEPLAPSAGAADSGENSELARALLAFTRASQDFAPLSSFLAAYPESRWKASLLANLGLLYRNSGYWSKALSAWETAWNLSKAATDPLLKSIADRTFGELTQLHARLGHFDRLEVLFKETEKRDIQGSGTERASGARAGLWLMKNTPGEAFRCGPLAVSRLYQLVHPHQTIPVIIAEMKSTKEGTCLSDLSRLASDVGLAYQMAFREAGAPVLYPSLVHWKVGHYAALTKPMGAGYLTQDPTFGSDTVVTTDVLDTEGSGYFLVPAGVLPKGWRTVAESEAMTIFGKGNAGPGGPPPPPCDSPLADPCKGCGGSGGGPGSNGMATYNLELWSVSLMVMDTPVGYSPPRGPAIQFAVNYNHREAASMTTISNLGPKWSFGWLSYILAPSDAATKSFGPSGGQLSYSGLNPSTGSFAPQLLNQDRLVKVSANSYVKHHKDGSREVFDLAETGVNPRIFRTQSIDARGNRVSYAYDANYRIRTVTDAIGQITVIDYDLSTDPTNPSFYKITKVTDPFGRFGTFQYNGAGQLWKITDVIGLTSSFVYGAGDFIASMTTPYGTTRFTASDSDYNRHLEATDPMGGRERIEWVRDSSGVIAASDPANIVPAGFLNSYLNYRNTFYWDKKAMSETPGDYTKARITHWEHATASDYSLSSPSTESTKAPLENRVWRAYPGQPNTIIDGTTNQPSRIARILDDGTEQNYQYEYNSQGNVTKSVDPLGRQTEMEYDSNGIDVLRIKQKNGTSFDLLASYTYNSLHQPLTATDASGQKTTYTYNSFGQPLTITNAKNQTTTYTYGTDPNQTDFARVKTITGALPDAVTHFTYDALGRLRTTTDSEGYVITTDYDAFDRPTRITYPDGTYEQSLYKRLDIEWSRDRIGRWTHSLHDALQHLVSQTDPLYRTTNYEWCVCGSMSALIDPAGRRTSWTRDIQSRVTEKIYPDRLKDTYTYESTTSRLKKMTDAKGQVSNRTYYVDNALAAIIYTDTAGSPLVPATPAVTYGYDAVYSRIVSMNDGVGPTAYSYNPVPTSIAVPVTGAGQLAAVDGPLTNDTIAYTYDELGRSLTVSINGNANVSALRYDTLGQIDQVTNPLGAFNYFYQGVTGRLGNIDYPNGQRVAYSYFDNSGDQRLKQIKNIGVGAGAAVLSQFDYTYNAVGEITTWTQNYEGAASAQRYEPRYDATSQLVGLNIKNAVTGALVKEHVYGYDTAGNRTQEQIDSRVTSSSYNNLSQLTGQSPAGEMEFSGTINEPSTVTLGGRPAGVDASNNWRGKAPVAVGNNSIPLVATDVNGNTTTKNINVNVAGGAPRTLSYDRNGNETDNGAGQRYAYNAVNQLVKITIGASVTEFVYNGVGQRVLEKLNGTLIKQWIWCGGAQPCEERDSNNNVTKRFFVQGEQIGNNSFYYSTDHLGSIREMTDSSGAVRARYSYDPYGRITKASGDLEADFGFTGFYRHQASGLSLTMYRAYDPELGRWPSRDPIEENGGLNPYLYVKNDPLNFVDSLGLKPGDPYPTISDAAIQAIRDINPTSIKEGREYAGLVYQVADGVYTYTSPNPGSSSRSMPSFFSTVWVTIFRNRCALYHTHGADDPEYNNEDFSSTDKAAYERRGQPGYVGTPSGDIKMYTPIPGKPGAGRTEIIGTGAK